MIVTYVLINKDLNYKEYNDRPMSDLIEVNAFFSSTPVATTAIYDIGEITINNMLQMIYISLPFKVSSGDNKNHAICTYLDEDSQVWSELDCSPDGSFVVNNSIYDSKVCCTSHLTLFGLVYDTYYDILAEIAFRQIIFSIIPVSIIYLALIIAITNAVLKYRKISKAKALKDRQIND